MKRGTQVIISAALVLLTSQLAHALYAADVSYDYTVSGSTYTFTVNVGNTSTGTSTAALDFFRIDLDTGDPASFQTVQWLNDNTWSSNVDPYDPSAGSLAPTVWAIDAGGGIAQGATLSGFQFSFDYPTTFDFGSNPFHWLAWFGTDPGSGIPSATVGEDPNTFGPLNELRYDPPPPPNTVPEPSTLLLIGTGLLGLAAGVRGRRARA